MVTIRKYLTLAISGASIALLSACQQTASTANENQVSIPAGQPAPFSDPSNKGGWVLNEEISDEFEGDSIDKSKWLVQGDNGEYYIWKGRAPSQFTAHNVLVEDGKLKIRSQWEPDYPFAFEEGHEGNTYGEHEGQKVPVTTGAVVSRKRFMNGYMEVKSKAADAAMTSSFWMIGYQQELDVFEQMGNPKILGNIREDHFKCTVHDWSPPAIRPTRLFGYSKKLPFRVADDFHVYGAEWGEDYLSLYIDGEHVHTVTQDELGQDWVLNNPMEIWLDSEIFTWLGLPHKEELPADFEVEYMRVWQKPSDNLLAKDRAFFGFEGPILFEDQPRPLDLLPESSIPDDYQKFWLIDDVSKEYLRFADNRGAVGVNSLKFVPRRNMPDVQAYTPKGAINLPAGEYEISFKIWLRHGWHVENLYLGLTSPEVKIEPFELTNGERGGWITMKKRFTKTQASNPDDQLSIHVYKDELPPGSVDFYLDDIQIKAVD